MKKTEKYLKFFGFFLLVSLSVAFFITGYWAEEKAMAEEKAVADAQAEEQAAIDEATEKLKNDITALGKKAAADGVQVAFSLYDENNLMQVSYRAHDIQHPASVYKLYIAAAVLDAIEKGDLDKDMILPLTGLSIPEAIGLMIVYSDNDTAVDLGQVLGWDKVEAACQKWHLKKTSFEPQMNGAYTGDITSTAYDTVLFLKALDQGDILSKEHRAFLYEQMKQQSYNNALSLGLTNQTFAHKTGFLSQQWNDAGIISTVDGRYLIAVYAYGYADWMPEAQAFYKNLGQVVRQYIEKVEKYA